MTKRSPPDLRKIPSMHRLSTVLILSLLSLPLFAAITPGPERPLSGITYDSPAGEQRPGAVASDGTDFLAAWTDLNVPHQGVFAARVTPQGAVNINSQRSIRAGAARDVSLCFANDAYLATWTDDATQSVFSAKLSRDGSVVAGPRVIVAAQMHDSFTESAGTFPRALACNGSGGMVVAKLGTTVMPVMLDSAGNVVKTGAALPIADGDPIATVTDGSKYFIGVRQRATSTIGVVPVDSNGNIGAFTTVFTGSPAQQVGMAYNNGRLALAAASNTALQRAFIDTNTMAITKLPDVAAGGQEVVVVANGSVFDVYLRPFSGGTLDILQVPFRDAEATAPQATNILHVGTLGTLVSIASNGRDNLAVWKDFRRSPATAPSDGDVFGAMLGAGGGTTTAPFPVAITARWQNLVAIATSGTESMAVWNERTGDANQAALMAMRFDAKGALLDAQPRQIASNILATATPAITWNGANYFVAWTESQQTNFGTQTTVAVQRLNQNGTPVGETIRYDGAKEPALGSNGSSTLLVFSYPDGRGTNYVLFKGAILTPQINSMNVSGYAMSIGSIGSDYLVTWTEGIETCQIICLPDRRDIQAMRISGEGVILDATPIPIATGLKDQAFPHVASTSSDYVVVYDSWIDGVWTLMSKRLTKNGSLVDFVADQDGNVLATDVAPSSTIARDDTSYVVAYDAGAGTDATALRLMRLNDAGALVEQSGSLGGGTRVVPTLPAAVKVPGGPVEIVYGRYAQESVYGGTMRAFLRLTPDAETPVGRKRLVRH